MRALKQFKLLDEGYTLDEVLNPEQNKAKLAAQYSAYKARQANPPRKCRRPSIGRTRSRRKVPTSTVFAQQLAQGDAMTEQVDRVNEKRVIPWNVGGQKLELEVGG